MFNCCVVLYTCSLTFIGELAVYYYVFLQNDINIDLKLRHDIPRHEVKQVCLFILTFPIGISTLFFIYIFTLLFHGQGIP